MRSSSILERGHGIGLCFDNRKRLLHQVRTSTRSFVPVLLFLLSIRALAAAERPSSWTPGAAPATGEVIRTVTPRVPVIPVISAGEIPGLGMKLQVIPDGDGGILAWYRAVVPPDGFALDVVLDCNHNGLEDNDAVTTVEVERAEVLWVSPPDPSDPHVLSMPAWQWSLPRPITFFISKNDGGRYMYAAAAVKDANGRRVRDWSTFPCITK
jgi:hypothetical protein